MPAIDEDEHDEADEAAVDAALESSPLMSGERVSFTGTLATMTHAQAASLVAQYGGESASFLTRDTTLLVVGEEGWPLESDGRPSQKLEQARRLIELGQPLKILRESDWLQWLGADVASTVHRKLYTPAMLSQMLDVPVHFIRRWERLGLIHPVRRLFRLPYFDFHEVISVRRLAGFVRDGVPVERIAESLRSLQQLWKDVANPLLQLQVLAEDQRLIIRDEKGRLEARTGQRLLEFDESAESHDDDDSPATVMFPATPTPNGFPDRGRANFASSSAADLSMQASRWQAAGRIDDALNACRASLAKEPIDPAVQFQMADLLYQAGNVAGAIERYSIATELDAQYVEAWTQLGCAAWQTGDLDRAEESLRIAVGVHPEHPDANFHLAELMRHLGRPKDGRPYWQQYLDCDDRGPWAEIARQRLHETRPQTADGGLHESPIPVP